MRKLFLDLDGVMADFETHFWNLFHKDPPSKGGVNDDEMWRLIHEQGDFFLTMPTFPLTKWFWMNLRMSGHEPIILTAASKKHYPEMAAQKMKWVRTIMGPDVMVIPTYGSASKALFLQNAGDILIDDYEKNCDRWSKAGGIAIHHTTYEKTLAELAIIPA